MLRKLFFYIVVLVFIIAGLITTVAYLSVDDHALVTISSNPTQDELQDVRDIINSNNPKDVLSEKKSKLILTQQQLNLLLQYGNKKFVNNLRVKTIFDNNRFFIKLSFLLPDNPIGKFINLSSIVRLQYAKYFVIEDLKIGSIEVPSILVTLIQPYILKELNNRYASYARLWNIVKRIDIYQSKMTVHYQLKRSDLRNIKKVATKVVIGDVMRERILVYAEEMEKVLNQLDSKEQTILNLISPIFAFAEKRALVNKDPVEENRVALLTLGAYMVGRSPAKYISDVPLKKLRKIKFTLKGRKDLSQHYLVSAALNALSGTKWSNTIGLQKELKDSDGGSGFSFVDLMADIAGNKMAAAAMSPAKATIIQSRLKLIGSEDEIIGETSGLLENLTKSEFRIEYGSVGSEEYIRVVRDIERRLFFCSLYKP